MAEKDDLVEAALAAMDEADGADEAASTPPEGVPLSTSEETPDPFDAAKDAMDAIDGEGGADQGSDDKADDPFEAALNALDTDDTDDSGGEEEVASGEESSEDPFAAALEIAKTEQKSAKESQPEDDEERPIDIDFLMEIKLELTFEVGRTKMYIVDLLSLGQGSVIELSRLVGEELELYVNSQLLATGEVVVINEKFGARVSKILSPADRIERLGADLDRFE